jgi:hypothetical protein
MQTHIRSIAKDFPKDESIFRSRRIHKTFWADWPGRPLFMLLDVHARYAQRDAAKILPQLEPQQLRTCLYYPQIFSLKFILKQLLDTTHAYYLQKINAATSSTNSKDVE